MSDGNRSVSPEQTQPPLFVGIDQGSRHVKVGVVDDRGRILARLTIAAEAEKGSENAAQRIGGAVSEAVGKAGIEPAAVACGGLAVRPEMAGAVPADLTICGRPVMRVDAGIAAAYGEFWAGAGRGFHSMVLLTLGTHIDCNVLIGDPSTDGEHRPESECGHMIIDCSEEARRCDCGQRGHLEAYVGSAAVIRRAREALADGPPSLLGKRLAEGRDLTPGLLAEAAETGDALARTIVADTARYVGVGIVNMMNTFDPSGVLFGGGMTFGGRQTPLGRQFLEWVKQEVARRGFAVLVQRTIIDFAGLDDDAGCIGAAGMARLEYGRM